MSRRLARKLNAELRGTQPGYVHLIAATYTALVRDLEARDAGLLAKELIIQPVVRKGFVQFFDRVSDLRRVCTETYGGRGDLGDSCLWANTRSCRQGVVSNFSM